MARIPEEELARVKREVDLVALVRAAGVELSPCGNDFRGLCPFHEEKTPSFVVTPNGAQGLPLFHCLGCNRGGSALDFLMLSQGVSLPHAYEILRSLLGPSGSANPSLSTAGPGRTKSTVPHLPLPVTRDADDQRLLNDVAAFYHETLLGPSGEEARQYLAKRGLGSAELIEGFRIGYANRTLGYRLPAANRASAGEVRRRLKALGIFREKSGREHFDGAVVFPVLAPETGDVLSIYARKIHDDLPESCARHLYLKGPHRGVWNVEALATSKECVITEGIIDACTLWVNGYKSVVAAYGSEGVIADHFAAWKKYGTEKVFIAFDRDDAGDRAAAALAPRLAEAGIDVHRVLFPRTKDLKDANAYAVKVAASGGSATEALGEVLRAAPFVLKGKPGDSAAETTNPAEAPMMPSALASGPAEETSSPPPSTVNEEVSSSALRATEDRSAPRVEAAATAATPPLPEPLPEATALPSAEAVGISPPAPEPSFAAAAASEGRPLPSAASSVTVNGDEVTMAVGDRTYRVLDLFRNASVSRIEVSLRASRGERYHADTFELQKARPREHYIEHAAGELGVEPEVVKKDLAHLLNRLEELLGQRVKRPAERLSNVEIPPGEKEEAFALLRTPGLPDRVVEDLSRVGLVGEAENKLVAYFAATSRKLASPLAVLIQSNSAAGKSTLMDVVLEVMPREDVEHFTAMTEQALYYMGNVSLSHRILAISEVAGAERAGYAIKMLQSEGEISIATTVKDPETGVMTTRRHSVEGPVAVFLTTTEAEVDEELANRAIVLTVNEDREQTKAIHEAQRRAQTLAGMLAREERQAVVRLHQNAQRLLRPLRVVNPFAEELTFESSRLRTRRDHVKYLTLIQAIALLHQYQRPIRQAEVRGRLVSYVEVTREDIAIADRLARAVFRRSIDDLAPQTRRLLGLLDQMVTARSAVQKVARSDLRFTRREVREYTAWGVTQTRVHMERLVELEYILVHRGTRGQSFAYELIYDGEGKGEEPFVLGLRSATTRPCYRQDSKLAEGDGELAGRDRA